MADSEPQNVYDDEDFFAGYSTLERFGAGWEQAAEHLDLLRLLPEVSGLRVLDLGCGAGQLAHYIATQAAEDVVGIDVSERMLAIARAEWSHPRLTYVRQAIEEVDYRPGRFELVVSSLALHYVVDYEAIARRIAEWLTPAGVFVFSTEHPIYTARLPADGWVVDEDSTMRWAIDRYSDEGTREESWFVEGVKKQHRTIATLMNGLLDAGLVIERVVEPVPDNAWLDTHGQSRHERRRPMFLLIRARKPA